jgi:hypothetical protein
MSCETVVVGLGLALIAFLVWAIGVPRGPFVD